MSWKLKTEFAKRKGEETEGFKSNYETPHFGEMYLMATTINHVSICAYFPEHSMEMLLKDSAQGAHFFHFRDNFWGSEIEY